MMEERRGITSRSWMAGSSIEPERARVGRNPWPDRGARTGSPRRLPPSGRIAGPICVVCALVLSVVVAGYPVPGASAAPVSQLPSSACGSHAWRQVDVPGNTAIHALTGNGRRVFASSRLAEPGDKLFTAGALDTQLTPLSGFTSTEDVPVAVYDVLLTGADPGTLRVALAEDGVLTSFDGGQDFGEVGLEGHAVTALEFNGTDTFAAASASDRSGIYRVAGPATWEPVALTETFPVAAFWDLEAGPAGDLWAATRNHGLWLGEPEGDGWMFSLVGDLLLQRATVLSVAVDASDANLIYAGLGERTAGDGASLPSRQFGILISRDHGRTWVEAARRLMGSTTRVFDVATGPTAGVAVAATWGQGLLRSADEGRSWLPMSLAPGMMDAADRGFFSALLIQEPVGVPGCRLLMAAGHHGLWVTDLAAFETRRVYVPWTCQSCLGVSSRAATAQQGESGADGDGAALRRAAPIERNVDPSSRVEDLVPTPVPPLVWPSD